MTETPASPDGLAMRFPFTGRWLVQNSPANRVPSHGTAVFATSYAIDFVPVDASGRSAPMTLRGWLRPESPERFAGFGRPILAPVPGTVVAAADGQPDHAAYRGLPSVGYALTQRQRADAGWTALAGNHVIIEAGARRYAAVCHLQQGSVLVTVGDRVAAGDPVGRCGNSGNSTEPHVHVQAIDRLDIAQARAVEITFGGGLPRNGEIVDLPVG